MDDTPDFTFPVALKDLFDLLRLCKIARVYVYDGAVLVLFGRIFGKTFARKLGDALKRGRVRVVVLVKRDDLEPPRLDEVVDDMRA